MERTNNRKVILVALFVMLIFVLLWYYFYYKDTETRINRLRKDITRLYKFKSELPILLVRYKKAQKEFEFYSKRLPLKEEIPSLLVRLSGIIRSQDVDLLTFRPGKAHLAKNKLYYIKPINITLRATYINCGNVFEKVSTMKRLFRIVNFTLSKPKIINSKKVLVYVSFSAETYYFKGKKTEGKKK